MVAHLTTPRRRARRCLAAAALLMVGPGALVACSASPGHSGTAGRSGSASDSSVSGTKDYVGPQAAPAPAPESKSAPVSILTGNLDLIRTGELGVEVQDLASAAARARAYVLTVGGQISSENSVLTADSSSDRSYPGPIPGSFVQMVMALPPDALDASMDSLAGLGTLTSRAQSVQDVTLQVVDLQSRTTTMRASIDRVRALMDRAGSIAEVVALESELTRREADLESMTGQLKALQSQSAVSTLVLTLSAAGAPAPGGDDRDGPIGALLNSLSALGDGIAATVTGVAAAVPFLALIALVGGVGWLIVRPRRRPAAAGPVESSEAPRAADAPVGADD